MRRGVVEGKLFENGKGQALVSGMRGLGSSGFSAQRRHGLNPKEPEVLHALRCGCTVQPLARTIRASRPLGGIRGSGAGSTRMT